MKLHLGFGDNGLNLALSPQILAPWTKKCSNNTKEKKPSKSEKEGMNYWLRWASQSLRMTSSSSWRLAALQINELLLSLQTVPFRPHHFAWSHPKLCSLCYFKFHSLSLSLSEVSSKVVDTILILAIPISMYRIIMYTDIEIPTFRISLNTGHIPTIPAYFEHYRAYRPVPKKKKFFFFFSFVIFEFL